MTEQQVADLLVSDLQNNFVWLQLGFASVCCVLLIIAATLATRAYAALVEARVIFYRASQGDAPASFANRQSTPQNINAASRRKKVKSPKRSLL